MAGFCQFFMIFFMEFFNIGLVYVKGWAVGARVWGGVVAKA